MADKGETTATDDAAAALRGTLIRRLAMAGVLVAILLGVLAFFDYLASTPEEPEAPVFTQPVPVAPRKEVSQPVTPTENLPEPPASTAAAAVEPLPPPPVAEAAPTSASVPAAEVAPAVPAKSGDGGRRPGPVAIVPPLSKPAAAVAPLPARPAPVVEETAPPQPAAVPAARVVDVKPPAVQRLFSGFLLQAGVFSSAQHAEELHAKLTLSGVPSSLETRVQVGPFRTRREAEAAQERLRELGVQTVLVAPAARR